MHDIDRGGKTTAARLAAMAALRNAQSEEDRARPGGGDGGRDTRGRGPAGPRRGAAPDDAEAPPRLGPEVSAGVYSAVEAALKRSRMEFLARLVDYKAKLDCETVKLGETDRFDTSLDEAQFVAHRIAGVGKTLGFADLGDQARQTEAAISAYKQDRTQELRNSAIRRICGLMGVIESICDQYDCPA